MMWVCCCTDTSGAASAKHRLNQLIFLLILDLTQIVLLNRSDRENVVRLYTTTHNLHAHTAAGLDRLVRGPVARRARVRVKLHVGVDKLRVRQPSILANKKKEKVGVSEINDQLLQDLPA